ncbi:murein L,D-transpeptidase catalytic domain family protein [Flammeovirga pectinis]|uniref:Murein L,D-transpeptidase catalytic domain family protein n=1 Tax=Flammeovirga pectinis TaxID=2494373 RepID=A0A3S9P435_9BACT|nr:murein L,D-transpeptidase catalytic domain family protein [Flammeovirga pectinis]AZQ62842.1 murein L,D-transpeptidase catalytic domain family protein [Flammeovirga pectinis]
MNLIKFKLLKLQFLFLFLFVNAFASNHIPKHNIVNTESENLILTFYTIADLESKGLSYDAFKEGVTGYLNLLNEGEIQNKKVLSIIDFSQPSNQKRLYIIDIEKSCLLLNTYVAHGVNSGMLYANKFSNILNSRQSSLGFYKASETYNGKYGLSLKLDGLEKNINHKARERAIVLHPAKYVSQNFINNNGYTGRSFGCPAVSYKDHQKIINYIKGGSVMFIYTNKVDKAPTDLSTLPENTTALFSTYSCIAPKKIQPVYTSNE